MKLFEVTGLITILLLLSNFSLFAIETKPKLNLEDPIHIIVLPAEDKSKTLGESKIDDIKEKVTKKMSRVGTFRVLNRSQLSVILKELALDLKGMTKGGEQKLLEKSDAVLHIETNLTQDSGKFLLKLNLNLILRDSQSFGGSATIEGDNLNPGIDAAVLDMVKTISPEWAKQVEVSQASPFAFVWRSAIVPGWGQIYKGNAYENPTLKYKGYAFVGLALLFGGGTISSYQNYKAKESSYNDVQSNSILISALLGSPATNANYLTVSLLQKMQSDAAHSQMESAAHNLTVASGVLATFYIYNLVDAYFFGGKKADPKNALNERGYSFFASPRIAKIPGTVGTETGWDIRITGRF